MTSALIMEDDADWDVCLKQQMQVFAQAARAFTQPARRAGITAKMLSKTKKSAELSISQLPTIPRSHATPFGDNWDILWLGHCGTDFPSSSTIVGNKAKSSKHTVTHCGLLWLTVAAVAESSVARCERCGSQLQVMQVVQVLETTEKKIL